MKILITDDEPAIRNLFEALLLSRGYTDLFFAESAQEAFDILGIAEGEEKYKDAPVDLIMMDLSMPGMDGIEACGKIKSVEHLKDIPVIIVTAMTDLALVDMAYKAGAFNYIPKPFELVHISAAVQSAKLMIDEISRRKTCEKQVEG